MEEYNLDNTQNNEIQQQPPQEAESLTTSPESVELSSPHQAVEAVSATSAVPELNEVNAEVNTVAEKKKTTKDFTPEERKLIIKRAKRAGSVKAARERLRGNNTKSFKIISQA